MSLPSKVWELQHEINAVANMAADSVFGGLGMFIDETCPKGILWFKGHTILRLDRRTHDAHVGAVGGE